MVRMASLCLLSALCAAMLVAQEPTGGVAGSVTDPSGAAVPRARITVEDSRTGRTVSIAADGHGEFTIPSLPAGSYNLRIAADGFAPWVRERVVIEIDRTVRIPAELSISGKESVDVSAAAPTVEIGRASCRERV